MHICFLIPDGVGIRNYLYSDIIGELEKDGHSVTVWHSLDEEVIQQAKRIHTTSEFNQYSFSFYKEDVLPRFLRDTVAFSRLKLNSQLKNNPTILDNWLPKKNLKGRISNFFAKSLASRSPSFEKIEGVEKMIVAQHRKSQAYKKYQDDLKKIGPDIVFCTHQREPNAGLAMLAARDLGIKTVTAIFSWDNLPKGRLPMRADFYLVWSEYMKTELLEYFPDIQEHQIRIVGTPQFDFYSNSSLLLSREEFANQWGLDPEKKWICFSGDDILTSPHDPKYLWDIAQSLLDQPSIQVIFRPVPVEGFERYQYVLEKFPEIKVLPPLWKKGALWSRYFPYPEDIQMLVNLAKHCGTVINVGSTMALDFAQFDHPGIYLNYEVNPSHSWSIKRVYRFQHFRSFKDLDAVVWINSKEEIKDTVLKVLETPAQVAKDRIIWRDRIVSQQSDISSSSRIIGFLKSIPNSLSSN